MRGINECYLCGRDMPQGDRNYFNADGIATCLVCPKDDPKGKKLEKALQKRLEDRRRSVLGR